MRLTKEAVDLSFDFDKQRTGYGSVDIIFVQSRLKENLTNNQNGDDNLGNKTKKNWYE